MGCSTFFSFCSVAHCLIGKWLEVVSLLSLMGESNFGLGRRGVWIWSLDPLEGFSCKSFFQNLFDPSLVSESIVASFTWLCEYYGLAFEEDALVSGLFLLYFWSCEFARSMWNLLSGIWFCANSLKDF